MATTSPADGSNQTAEALASRRRLRLQLQLSVLRARIAVAPMFLTALVISFGELLINFFRPSSKLDWKSSLAVSAVLSAIWFLGVFVSAIADLRAEDLRERTANPVFPANNFVRGLYGTLVIGSLLMSCGMYRQKESLGVQVIPAIILVLVWYGWPRAVHFYAESLGQRTRSGRMKRLRYRAVEYASHSPVDGLTLVGGGDIVIQHSAEHADKQLFHELVEERTGKAVFGA